MNHDEKVNILLVDDQPAKLISYEVILAELDENLIKASSAREALECLLRNEIAVILIDVCMPDLDGFELAAMIREHPRFQKTAIIFISAIHLAENDRLRGYKIGAVDYMPVPIVPEILRAKVNVFAELYRKTRALESFNRELELRVAERTAELEGSTANLVESERRRSMALEAGQMGSWDWQLATGKISWDVGQSRIFGIDPAGFDPTLEGVRAAVHPQDWNKIMALIENPGDQRSFRMEIRFLRPDGEIRHCVCAAALTSNGGGEVQGICGVTVDITERKRAEEYHALLAREVDHRAKNALAVVQSIVRLTSAPNTEAYVKSIEGRIKALSHAHALLSESRWLGASLRNLIADELAPYNPNRVSISGDDIKLEPAAAQSFALILHELATNSAKYGALSSTEGKLDVRWSQQPGTLVLGWKEAGGPTIAEPTKSGFGVKVIRASVEGQLGGSVRFDWRPAGLLCSLTLPLPGDAKQEAQTPSEAHRTVRESTRINGKLPKQVLVVEDEALVAMMMEDAIADMGLNIVGPFSHVKDAVNAVKTSALSAAILDVNLRGESVYEVADQLILQRVPFLFMTGYGRENIDRRFSETPLLRKPVDIEQLKQALASLTSLNETPALPAI